MRRFLLATAVLLGGCAAVPPANLLDSIPAMQAGAVDGTLQDPAVLSTDWDCFRERQIPLLKDIPVPNR